MWKMVLRLSVVVLVTYVVKTKLSDSALVLQLVPHAMFVYLSYTFPNCRRVLTKKERFTSPLFEILLLIPKSHGTQMFPWDGLDCTRNQHSRRIDKKSNLSLRVTGATWLYRGGITERSIQARTGHKSIEALRVYE